MRLLSRLLGILSLPWCLTGCLTTSMQGYADRQLPAKPVSHIIAYVAAPGPLAASIQTNIQEEAHKHQVAAEDAP